MPTIREHLDWHLKGPIHRRVARGVLNTPPLPARGDGLILFSMLGSTALAPYLVAAKTLGRALGRGRAVVLDDGTLTPADRRALERHLPDVEIRHIGAVDTGPCPPGGTWERLLSILDLRAQAYVVQLDSDTLTLGEVPEVADAIRDNRSFSLRGEAGSTLLGLPDFVAGLPPRSEPMHVQHAAERTLGRLALPIERPRYFRGCAGFAGFAQREGGRALAEAFSAENQQVLGAERWAEWGTEQVTSNFLIANDPDPLLLPYDRYLNYGGEPLPADARFAHFLGTFRFTGTAYLTRTRAAIRALSA